MTTSPFSEALARYRQLRSDYQRGLLTADRFSAEVGRLQFSDSNGTWWTIRAQDGQFLRYDGASWVQAQPPGGHTLASAVRSQDLNRQAGRRGGFRLRMLIPFAGLILSTSCGLLWTFYSMLAIGKNEQADYITPLVLGGVPIMLWLFRRPIDRLLGPLEPARSRFPRPLLLGAAFATPVLLGLVCSSFSNVGYGGMRMTALLSILTAHVLTRSSGAE